MPSLCSGFCPSLPELTSLAQNTASLFSPLMLSVKASPAILFCSPHPPGQLQLGSMPESGKGSTLAAWWRSCFSELACTSIQLSIGDCCGTVYAATSPCRPGPTNVFAANVTATQLIVYYGAPASDGGSAITGYWAVAVPTAGGSNITSVIVTSTQVHWHSARESRLAKDVHTACP